MENRRDEEISGTAIEAVEDTVADRRKFLATCGRFSVVTPPAITLLLSTSLATKAIALSGGRGWSGDGDRDWRPHEHHYHDRDRD